jgi:hypothetical protein
MKGVKVRAECIERVKLALKLNGFPNQKVLADDVGLALATVSNFLNGKPVFYLNFSEICRALGLDWEAIADLGADFTPIQGEEGLDSKLLMDRSNSTSEFYVNRPPIESICCQEILQPYALLRIKAPKHMGKTWLMSKVLNFAKNHDCQSVAVNLREAVDSDYSNLDQFLQFFCTTVSSIQGLPNRVTEHWGSELGNEKVKCRTYFEKYLLASEQPLVLALDELNRVYPYPEIAGHFLGMLRTWHESAKTKEVWRRLRVVVVYVEAYTQMNRDQSPFNVGTGIELPIFTQEQVRELVQMMELSWDHAQVTQLMDVVGGLPYLVHRAVSHLNTYQDTTLKEFLATAHTFDGIYEGHLRGLWRSLEQQPELIPVLRQVVSADGPVQLNWEQGSKLHGMGLVHLQGNQVTPSCELYRHFFREQR